jgi:uncharacterized membrane protein YuzA (DUF378 family)
MKSFLAIFITVIVLGFLYSHFSFSKVSPELSITSTSKYSSLKTRAVAASCALAPDKEEYATCNYTCPNGTTILGISQCGGACTPNNLGGTLSYYDHKTFRTVTVPPSSCSSSSCTNGAINYPACNICPGAATANIFNTQCVGTCDSRNTCTLKNVCGQSITGYMCNGKCGSACVVAMIAKILVVVGALNWGLVGVGMFINYPLNLVNLIFSSLPMVEALVYMSFSFYGQLFKAKYR